MAKGLRELESLCKGTNSIAKTPSFNMITLGIRYQHRQEVFRRTPSIHSVARTNCKDIMLPRQHGSDKIIDA
jgi:hypothetical protein